MSKRRCGNVVSVICGSPGKSHFFQRVHVEVFSGSNIRCVWTKETDSQEKRFVFSSLHQIDCLSRDHAVRLLFVVTVSGQPTERRTDFSMRLCVKNEVLVGFIASLWIDGLIPRRRIVKAVGANRSRDVVVIDFSNSGGKVTSFLKRLRQRHNIRNLITKMPIQIVDLDFIWSKSRHYGSTRRIAKWQLIVGAVKTNARRSKAIDIRCLCD